MFYDDSKGLFTWGLFQMMIKWETQKMDFKSSQMLCVLNTDMQAFSFQHNLKPGFCLIQVNQFKMQMQTSVHIKTVFIPCSSSIDW